MNMQVTPNKPTDEVPPTSSPAITPAQAVDQWMAENGITDPSTMTRAQLAELLTHLKSLQSSGANIPGLGATIQNLEAAQKANPPVEGNAAEQYLADLKLNSAALTAIDPQKYSESINKLTTTITGLDKLLNDINMSISSKKFDPASTRADIENQIAQIDAMEAAGVPVGELGLAEYRSQLQGALANYDTEMAGIDPSSTEGKVALSKLRESALQAKLTFLSSTNPTGSSAAIDATEAGLRGEELRQTKFLTPWENTTATPEELTVEGIEETLSILEEQYAMAAAEGDQTAMSHIEAKMNILNKAKTQLEEGKNPLSVGIVVFYELRKLDVAQKTVLQADLRKEISELQNGPNSSDPAVQARIEQLNNQVNSLDAEINALNQQMTRIFDQYQAALDLLTSNTNETMSKAFK